jgi:hypothetical protein
MSKFLLVFYFLPFSIFASDAKWIGVGELDGVYYDANSFKRSGQIVEFQMRLKKYYVKYPGYALNATIDCKTKFIAVDGEYFEINEGSNLWDLMQAACKPAWKFWK